MDRGEEYRFLIDAYAPDTMPLARLAMYLEELAKVLGEDKYVHLISLLPGSTVLVHKVDAEAIPRIRERAAAVKRGDAPADAMRAYHRINRFLAEDNGSGSLMERGAEVIPFPGREQYRAAFASIQQQGELDGEVVRIGGLADPVPLTLQVGGEVLTGCYARRSLAKPLGSHLFEPIRVFGTGRWRRDIEGIWQLERFNVDHFEVLQEESLSSVLVGLRALEGDQWTEAGVDDILRLRHGEVK